jgi:hypothetical protein
MEVSKIVAEGFEYLAKRAVEQSYAPPDTSLLGSNNILNWTSPLGIGLMAGGGGVLTLFTVGGVLYCGYSWIKKCFSNATEKQPTKRQPTKTQPTKEWQEVDKLLDVEDPEIPKSGTSFEIEATGTGVKHSFGDTLSDEPPSTAKPPQSPYRNKATIGAQATQAGEG